MVQYDFILVGGGHNALVCAFYLAKAGVACGSLSELRSWAVPRSPKSFILHFATLSQAIQWVCCTPR